VGIAAFTEEEGSRFGVACLGSRLLTGAFPLDRVPSLVDRDGVTPADAMAEADVDPASLGPDPSRLETARRVRRAAHRAGSGAGRAHGRGGERDLAARPLAAELHR
jgi:hypothetical protein